MARKAAKTNKTTEGKRPRRSNAESIEAERVENESITPGQGENGGDFQPAEEGPIIDSFDFGSASQTPVAAELPSNSNGHEKKKRARPTRVAAPAPVESEAQREPDPLAMDTAIESASEPDLATQVEAPDATLRQQLMHELDEMIGRIRTLHPGYNPPPFSPRALMDLVSQNMDKLPTGFSLQILDKLRETIGPDLFDVNTWKGIWYVLNSTLQMQGDVIKRRMTGEYQTDEWGMDPEFRDAVRPFFDFMYKTYWRIETTGMENIPTEGRGLLVANHSGQIPWDGAMIATGVLLEHPNNRMVRPLLATWFPTLPFLSDFLIKSGGVLATEDNGARLLEQDQLVLVLPEGYKGIGKLYAERYRLARFGRGGFVQMALKAHAPMIPISVVGAEETYVSLGKSTTFAKLTGFPYFPITPTFPWLGPLGFIPLPTKWYIDIGAPIPTDGYKEGSEHNPVLVSQLTDQVRNIVQEMIYARLAQRRSVFFK